MTTPRTLPPCDHDDCPPTYCKREELERAYSRLVVEYQRTQAELDSARRELEQLKKDKERLDWLENFQLTAVGRGMEMMHSPEYKLRPTIDMSREAIDAAMRKET